MLFGVLAMRPEDLTAVTPDIDKVESSIKLGFTVLRGIRAQGGAKVERSEKFLRSLMRSMCRQRNESSSNEARELGDGVRSGQGQAARSARYPTAIPPSIDQSPPRPELGTHELGINWRNHMTDSVTDESLADWSNPTWDSSNLHYSDLLLNLLRDPYTEGDGV